MNTPLQSKHLYYAAVHSSFKFFSRHAFEYLNPGTAFSDNWHIDSLVYHLEGTITGRLRRLLVNMPPRHLKSFLASVAFPAFVLGHDPTAKIIVVSYSDELAKKISGDFRRIIESGWYQGLFRDTRWTKLTETEVVSDQGGFRFATSTGGTLTGRGGDFIIIDDPTKPADALSDVKREATNEWYRNTLLSRLDDSERGVLILVMQRLHANDLTKFASDGGGFTPLSFPAIATRDERILVGPDQYYDRREGDVLHPERQSLETLQRIEADMSSYYFNAQYQQAPEMPQGAFFKRRWFEMVTQWPKRGYRGRWYVSIDAAQSQAETADYSAFTVIYANDQGYWITDAFRARLDYEQLVTKSLDYFHRFDAAHFDMSFLIEAASNGTPLYTTLVKAGCSAFYYQPKDDKLVRAGASLPAVAAGRVRILNIPGRNAWVEPFMQELMAFPQGHHDDWVDSFTQFIPWAERRHNPGGSYVPRVR